MPNRRGVETARDLSRYNKFVKKINVVVVLDEEFYLSSAKIGAILGVSSRTVQRYKEEGYIGLTESGFPLIEAIKHYIRLLKDNIAKKQQKIDSISESEPATRLNSLKIKKLEAEVRERNAIADIKELERDKLQGSLIEVDEVVNHYKDLVIRAKAKFLSLPDKLALELSGMSEQGEIQELLQLRIDECLNELSREDMEVEDLPVDDIC